MSESKHTPSESGPWLSGERRHYKFQNGFGASVIRTPYSHGGKHGLWEMAVLGPDGDLCYSTPITSDVLGHLSESEVEAALDRVQALNPDGTEGES